MKRKINANVLRYSYALVFEELKEALWVEWNTMNSKGCG